MSARSYMIKAYSQTAMTEKDRQELNKALAAIGEPPLLDLTEEERAAKKEREDAEECCGTRPDDGVKRNDVGVDIGTHPEWANTVQKQEAMGGTWNVKYGDGGVYESCWKDQ